ncbi:MAG: glycosyltransferase family A protein [Cyclobacteriaceae bacterium]
MQKLNELVSVIIPTHKRPVHLKRAIDSVLNQSYSHLEIIVVDDNNDGDTYRKETELLMNSYQHNDVIYYVKHKSNRNGAAARNTGIRSSRGGYLAFLDDDDIYLPNKVANQVLKLRSLSVEWGACCCFHQRRYKQYIYKMIDLQEVPSGDYTYEFLSGKTSITSSTLLVRRGVFDEVGLFDETFERHQDWEFLVRFFRQHKMAVDPTYSVHMQTEGFRNYPSAEKALQLRTKFLKTFEADIMAFPESKWKSILHYQWLHVACLFVRERKFRKSMGLIKRYVLPYKTSLTKDFAQVVFFFLDGVFPGFNVLYYKIVSRVSYRNK